MHSLSPSVYESLYTFLSEVKDCLGGAKANSQSRLLLPPVGQQPLDRTTQVEMSTKIDSFKGQTKIAKGYQGTSNFISNPGNFISNPGNFISKAWK